MKNLKLMNIINNFDIKNSVRLPMAGSEIIHNAQFLSARFAARIKVRNLAHPHSPVTTSGAKPFMVARRGMKDAAIVPDR